MPSYNDAIEWAEIESDGQSYNPVSVQLMLSFAAMHTMTDLAAYTLVLLASNPASFEPLRKEMVAVLRDEGWKTSAVNNLKLLDSTLKEAQRLKPPQLRKISLA